MSNESAVSMHELELETPELLPTRETLWCCKGGYQSHGAVYSFSQGTGNSAGFINVPIASDDLNNVSINILGL
jgi:hypothetical protein